MVELLTLIALAQMWNLLAGFAGVVSVGQQAFVGLGAYGMIVFVNNQGFNLYLSVAISAVAAMVVSIPMGLIAFRLRGSYFAIGTWVLAEVCSLLMINNTSVGGGSGASIKVTDYDLATRQDVTYWFALVAGVGAIVVSYVVLRSRLGLRMQAIRDNEAGARGLGDERVPHAVRDLDDRRVLDGVGRRDVLPGPDQGPTDRNRFGVQRRAVDRADHLHRRDRWHRHDRGPGDRGGPLLPVPRAVQGPGHVVHDHARRHRDRGRARLAEGGLGHHPQSRTGLDLFPVRRRLVVDRSEPASGRAQSGGSDGSGARPNHSAIPAMSTTRRTARDGSRSVIRSDASRARLAMTMTLSPLESMNVTCAMSSTRIAWVVLEAPVQLGRRRRIDLADENHDSVAGVVDRQSAVLSARHRARFLRPRGHCHSGVH